MPSGDDSSIRVEFHGHSRGQSVEVEPCTDTFVHFPRAAARELWGGGTDFAAGAKVAYDVLEKGGMRYLALTFKLPDGSEERWFDIPLEEGLHSVIGPGLSEIDVWKGRRKLGSNLNCTVSTKGEETSFNFYPRE